MPHADTTTWVNAVTTAGGAVSANSEAAVDYLVAKAYTYNLRSKVLFANPLAASGFTGLNIPLWTTGGSASFGGFASGDYSATLGLLGDYGKHYDSGVAGTAIVDVGNIHLGFYGSAFPTSLPGDYICYGGFLDFANGVVQLYDDTTDGRSGWAAQTVSAALAAKSTSGLVSNGLLLLNSTSNTDLRLWQNHTQLGSTVTSNRNNIAATSNNVFFFARSFGGSPNLQAPSVRGEYLTFGYGFTDAERCLYWVLIDTMRRRIRRGSANPLTASTEALLQGSTGNVVTLTGIGTSWTGGTTFTLSGGTGASITSQTVNSATSAQITITTGSAIDVLTITDPTNSETASIAVVDVLANNTISVNDSSIIWSPYSTLVSGSSYAQMHTTGSYARIKFTGTSLSAELDTSMMGDIPNLNRPTLQCMIDNATPTEIQVTSNSIQFATGLAAGNHEAVITIIRHDYEQDNWITPENVVRFTSFSIDGDASPIAQSPRSKKAMIFGDSLTQGVGILGSAGDFNDTDALASYAHLAGLGLGCEFGQIGYGAQGWTIGGFGGISKFPVIWDQYSSAASRLTGGLIDPAPDYIIVVHGVNDKLNGVPDNLIENEIVDWLPDVRSKAPGAYIFLVIPFSGAASVAITNGFNTYQASTPDSKAKLINLGTEAARGLAIDFGAATAFASDRIHPYGNAHSRIAALLVKAIQESIAPARSRREIRI